MENKEYKIGSFKVSTVADMIKYFRHKHGFNQKELAVKIGSFITKYDNTVISDYETGKLLPGIDHIYKLSLALNIDKDVFFNAVLREHYERFSIAHHKLYFEYINRIRKCIDPFEDEYVKKGRYFFCSEGKISYRFPEFSKIMKKCYRESGKSYKQIRDEMEERYDIYKRYPESYIITSINGTQSPSMRIVIDLSKYFNLDPFKMYSLMVKEKALAHAANMMKQWELYKEKVSNEQK